MGCDCKEGQRGPQGLQGPQGPQGATGPQGPQGPAGATGAQGLTGPQGAKGRDGLDGAVGPIGPQGPAGIPGIDGINGADGTVGATGPKGDKGDTGATGPKGDKGDKGDRGATGTAFGFLAEDAPPNVTKVAIALGSNDLCDAGAVTPTPVVIYDDLGGQYDTTTGVFTVPKDGRYNLHFYVTLKVAAGWSAGRVTAGLIDPSGCIFYTVCTQEGAATYQYLHLTGSALGVYLTEGTQIALSIMNATSTDYVSDANDIARFSVQQLS